MDDEDAVFEIEDYTTQVVHLKTEKKGLNLKQ